MPKKNQTMTVCHEFSKKEKDEDEMREGIVPT
jgi:hypothetical protein